MSINVRDFKRVVFFTGAGMSAESGIPTYRGKGGMWEQYNYEDYACQPAFLRNPEGVWEFHEARRKLVAGCEPNEGHRMLARLESELPHVWVITQNIDGLHQRAGAKNVMELHGSLWRVRCDVCGVVVERHETPMSEYKHTCGGYWRPDIVWFGDSLNSEVIGRAMAEIKSCDLFVSIGTSGVVYPAAYFPMIAKENDAMLVEINLQDTDLSLVYDLTLRGTATELLVGLMGE